ncbi:TPA_asm: matrix protein [birds-foot trefoil-associated virus]|uniref:Matrix protein n=1 Tax=birds-foot trefoil-associated virus TaxID=3121202 RepID=A0A9Y0T7F8_9RHAB|nr:TPA_asm: matrix protein [Bird's-foot trefoil nucleorhabdovirus]
MMNPASFSVKGCASITFGEQKDQMSSSKIWSMLANIWSYYPEKVSVYVSHQRGATEKTLVSDEKIKEALYNLVGGCIETCNVQSAVGSSMNLLLGQCHEYRLPFGTRSSDVGHNTILIPLPFPLDGCYVIHASFDGVLKKRTGKEHYMAEMDLDIHIGSLNSQTYSQLLQRGIKVYPFKLKHPEYFEDGNSSGSEFTTDMSDSEQQPNDASGRTSLAERSRKLKTKVRPILKKTLKRRKIARSAIGGALELLASKSAYLTGQGPSGKDNDTPRQEQQGLGMHDRNDNTQEEDTQ